MSFEDSNSEVDALVSLLEEEPNESSALEDGVVIDGNGDEVTLNNDGPEDQE